MGPETETVHPEITRFREHMEQQQNVSWFIRSVEIPQYERDVVEALTVALPRLWAFEYEDATGMPQEWHDLVAVIERTFELDLTTDRPEGGGA